MTASARSARTRPRPGARPIEPAPFDDGLFGHVLITFALGGTILGVCALIDQWALGWTLAGGTVLFCLALIHRRYHRDLIRYAAAQALIGLAVSTTSAGRPPGRGWARRWTGGWVGHPRRLTLHFAPDLDANNMAWQQELLPLLGRRFGVHYRITKVDMRRCRLNLRERPTTTRAEADPLHTRATEVAGLLLGSDAKSTINCDDAGSLTSVEASYTTNPRMASGNYRARIEAVFSAMLPGRWRARWDIENNQVRFEIRPQLPRNIPRPPVPANPDPDRIPLAVGEDGQLISWYLKGTAPHMMVAGKSGTGKTAGMIGVVLEAAARAARVWVCDPKRVEFLGLRGWPNVQIVATTVEDQIAVIHAAWREMEARYAAIESGEVDESTFTPLILVLDEYRDFVAAATEFYAGAKRTGMPSKAPVFEKVSSLARKGRTARIHLVLGTQRPDAEFLGGEALATDTPIPTPQGWKTMGEIEPGQHVFAEDGRVVRVTATTNVVHGRPCYRVTFSDRSAIVTDANHLWAARNAAQRAYDPAAARALSRNQRWPGHAVLAELLARMPASTADGVGTVGEFEKLLGNGRVSLLRHGVHDRRLGLEPLGTRPGISGRFGGRTYRFGDIAAALKAEISSPAPSWRNADAQIVTTREMASSLHTSKGESNWSVQLAPSLNLPAADVPIDAWLLGYWLGDGHKATSTIATADGEVLDRIRALGYRVTHYARFNYGISTGERGGAPRPTLKAALRELGVLGNKHIPAVYLRASAEQRAQLLAGLLDADGTCAVRSRSQVVSGQVTFTNVNRGLIDGVAELAASLGLIPTVRLWRPAGTERYASSVAFGCRTQPAWMVSFTPDRQVFGIRRKQRMLEPALGSRRRTTTRQRYVVSIEPVEPVPVRCITVDSPAHLYLAGRSFIPTHNCRDNFNTRMSFGRLSPQGAQMMWENAAIGVSVPNRVAGRGVGVTDDDEPVEIQGYFTVDPRRAKTAQDVADLEQFRPPAVTHPPLSVRPLQHLLDGEGPPMIWEAYANAELVPADPTEKPEPGIPPDITETPSTSLNPDDAYGPPQPTRADHLQPGDLILIDEGWVVVEIAEADVLDDSITDIDWRSDDDESGSLSTPTTTTFDTRREEIE